MSTQYTLQVVRLEGSQKKRCFSWTPSHLYVVVKLGDNTRKTRTIRKSKGFVWEEPLIFDSSDQASIFTIQVKRKSPWRSDHCVGYADISLADLLKKCADGDASIGLSTSCGQASTGSAGSIFLRLESGDLFAKAENMLDETDQGIQQSGIAQSEIVASTVNIVNDLPAQANNESELYQVMKELLSTLEVFKNVIDAVSEIHPFLTIAWSVTSGLLQVVAHVFETDARVVGLVQSMRDVFAFVSDLKMLSEKVRTLQEPIIGLLKQTVECCVFVREYTRHRFVERMFDINSSEKLDEFEKSLVDFKAKINAGATIHTAVVSLRISEAINTLLLYQLLKPSPTDTFDRPVCLPGTRLEVQEQILGWLFSETKHNVLWLHGVAGSGKSTLCTTIAHHLRRLSRLGAYVFFERGKSEPSTVIRTLAYKLASFDSSIASGVLSAIQRDHDIITASSGDQFDKLLMEPLTAAASKLPGPVVIALDALDECGTSETRRGLMQILNRVFLTLPSTFRFIITSRAEHDIETMLSSLPENVQKMQLDYTSVASQEDVLLYIKKEMHKFVKEQVTVPPDWPWDENVALLGKTAGGLFIWAATAVKLVSTSDNPFATLEELVTASYSPADFGLYQLYESVLRTSGIVWMKDASRSRFQKVMGLLLLSKVPLSSRTIDGILGFPPQESSLLILSKLRCLLAYSPELPGSLFHASLSDYLLSHERRGDPWFIDVPAQHYFIATRCFSIMEKLLHFNMCDLETSFVHNDDIPDLQDRINKYIPSHLNYACAHWSQHLCDASYSSDLFSQLSDFAYQRLLFWFEVLSLGSQFRVGSPALLDAARWAVNHDANVSSFLTNASKLASEFAFPVSQSSPHIYLSMIPLTKIDSEVSTHYSNLMTYLVRVERRGIKRPPRWLKVLEGHRGRVWSVAISPDGTRIASASEDRTVRVWNSNSGEETLAPLTGHSGDVTTVSFSPDGTRLVSGSQDRTLRIWNAQDGSLILGQLLEHTNSILCVAYSLDGEKIASGSSDKTIIVWNAFNGDVIAGPFNGHTDRVQSVAFSPEGTQLVSGSNDNTIRIWNVDSGELVLEPFTDHDDNVNSVAFSRDGEYVVSGSDDMTIRIWEVKSGSAVKCSFRGHTAGVTSVAYSPCGARIVSGSGDNTIRVWDAKSGYTVSGSLEGHASTVSSIAISPDGSHIVSGSHDETVRIWPATPLETDAGPFSGHKGAVTCVRFSSDASCVASASMDGSIVIWGVHSGDVVSGPFGYQSVPVNDIGFSPDNSRLISGSDDCKVRIWDVKSGKIVCTMEGHTDEVWCVALSHDNMKIASGSRDGTIRVWRMEDGMRAAEPLTGHSLGVMSLAFSPDGKRLVSASEDRTIRMWETRNWKTTSKPPKVHNDEINSVCFSPDGKQIASGSDDHTVILWDAESCEVIGGPFRATDYWVRSVIFSLDGKHVLSGSEDKTIRIWNIETGQTICDPLKGHSSGVFSLALSPDGTRLASGSLDNTIRVWDLSRILGKTKHEDGAKSDSIDNETSVDLDMGENGWILGGRNRRDLVLWIPPDLRRTLWNPRNTAIFSCEFSTKLDFTGAALGERWTECFSS